MANRSTGLMSVQNGSTMEDCSRHPELEAFEARSVRAGRIRLAIVGLSLSAVVLNWLVPGFQAVSPGLACCAVLLWLTNGIVDERDLGATHLPTSGSHTGAFNAWKWGVGVPLLFAVWSCVDDTFWIGWTLLGAATVGRGLDGCRDSRRRTSLAHSQDLLGTTCPATSPTRKRGLRVESMRSPRSRVGLVSHRAQSGLARDRSFVRWLSLLTLAVAATLLGPNGLPWIEQARGDFVLTGRWFGEVFDQTASVESAALVVLTDDAWQAVWWRSALLAGGAAGGVWWLTWQAVKQSGRCFASAEQGVLLLFTILLWWKPELGEWFVLAWAIVLAPHLADLVERGNAAHETVLGESGGSMTTNAMSEGRLSDFALADAVGGWMRTLRFSVVRLSHVVRRLALDEEALMLDVGRSRTASIVLMPVFAIVVVVTATWFVRHAGAGSVSDVECVPRVRPVGVSPLFDEKSVVSDAQLSRVFSSPSLAVSFRSGDSSSELLLEQSHWAGRENCAGEPGGVSPRTLDSQNPGADAQWHSLCECSRHIPCAVTGKMRTAHGVCLLLCGQSECHWADATRLTRLDSFAGQLGRIECPRERDLARCLATAGWRGLTADTVLQTADGGRSISTLLRQLRREFRLRTPSPEQHPCTESLLAFAFYMPDTRHWLDAEGLPVTFDMLVARVLKQESSCDAIDEREATPVRDALAELDRLWSLAVLLRIDDQQSLFSERTRSLLVDRLRLATRQLCETQRRDGSWDECWQDEAASRTAVQSESEARLLITAHTLAWWGLCPREVLPTLDVRIRAAHWLCNQFEGFVPAIHERRIVPRVEVVHHSAVVLPTVFAPAHQAALCDAAQALALWRGRTAAVAFREVQLHRKSSSTREGPADRVAVEPHRLNQPDLE